MNATSENVTRPTPRELAEIRVAEAMHAGVITCTLSTPLSEVARVMARHRVHCVVARDEDDGGRDVLWGVVSDLDLVAAAGAGVVHERTAGRTAATPLLMVAPDETLQRAAQLMSEHAAHHLVVVEPVQGRPIGVLSTLDIAAALAAPAGA